MFIKLSPVLFFLTIKIYKMNKLLKSFASITMLAVVLLLGTSMSSNAVNEVCETTDVSEHFFADYTNLADLTCVEGDVPESYVCGNWNLKYRRNCGSCSYQSNGTTYNFRILRYTKLCYYPNSPEYSWVIDTGDLCHEACY